LSELEEAVRQSAQHARDDARMLDYHLGAVDAGLLSVVHKDADEASRFLRDANVRPRRIEDHVGGSKSGQSAARRTSRRGSMI
jgi:hypothetical protein